jgi:phosphatidylserine decarboxylase
LSVQNSFIYDDVGSPFYQNFLLVTRTGWDMDPFLVISFGKKVFRTRVIRHSLNPVWDEKLLFHVREYEKTFQIQFAVLDWDKLSSNDHIGHATLDIAKLLANAQQPDPVTGLYAVEEEDHMKEFELPITIGKEAEDKYHPVLTFWCVHSPRFFMLCVPFF